MKFPTLIIFSIPFILLSCKAPVEENKIQNQEKTLKSTVIEKENSTTWTKEMETSKLVENLHYSKANIGRNQPVNRNTLNVISDLSEKIYPEYEGLGNLDPSKYSLLLSNFVNDFCTLMCTNLFYGPEQKFDSAYVFNYVLFKDLLIKEWPVHFETDFPVTEEMLGKYNQSLGELKVWESRHKKPETAEKEDSLTSSEESPQQDQTAAQTAEDNKTEESVDGAENNTSENQETSLEDVAVLVQTLLETTDQEPAPEIYVLPAVFTSYIKGEPYIGNDLIEVPVRFICQPGYVDVTLFLDKKSQTVIQNIKINRWEREYGKL